MVSSRPLNDVNASISVVIPALNEEATVGMVVARAFQAGVNEVVVVDNGSTDRTAEVAAANGARVVSEPRRGYGAACLAGSLAARGDLLVFMDADGSFDAAEIPRLVAPLIEGKAELVLGSRELGTIAAGAMPSHQRFGNRLAAWLLRAFYGLRISDIGPFRALRRRDLIALQMSELTYGWPIEMILKAAQQGYRIVEVPVTYRSRLGGRSKVSGTLKGSLIAGYRILGTLFKYARNGKRRGARL